MNNITVNDAFENGKAFIGFLTGGDPSIEKSEQYIMKMIEAGCDLIEIGIPFSDPIAEGEVIQRANIRALSAGTTTDKLFKLAGNVRKKTRVPLVFLTYLNPVFKYGYASFCAKCKETGVNGLIIPDMPYEERKELEDIAEKHDVSMISLIAPTSKERIEMIADAAKGFIYVVSSMGVTGMRNKIETDLNEMLSAIKKTAGVPAAVGFGINTPEQAEKIAQIADGVIVGSAIVRIIEKYGEDADAYIFDYVKSMKDAIRQCE